MSIPTRPGFPIRSACLLLYAAIPLTATGCGSEATVETAAPHAVYYSAPSTDAMVVPEMPPQAPPMAGMGMGMGMERGRGMGMPGMMASLFQGEAAAPAEPIPTPLPRKVIYNANLTLVVEDASATGDRIASLVKAAGGYISETDLSGDTNSQRQSTWKVRVPVEGFDGFLAAVSKLGELQRSHVDSQDVTQEYFDLEARIKNKQLEETRLLKHLEESTGKLEDILAVERELTRVRGEIEQMQGRIRYLGNVTSLSTVSIALTEVRDYVPPVAPTFATRISRRFQESIQDLTDFGQGAVLWFVGLVPWLPLIVVGVIALLVVLRRVRGVFRPRVAG